MTFTYKLTSHALGIPVALDHFASDKIIMIKKLAHMAHVVTLVLRINCPHSFFCILIRRPMPRAGRKGPLSWQWLVDLHNNVTTQPDQPITEPNHLLARHATLTFAQFFFHYRITVLVGFSRGFLSYRFVLPLWISRGYKSSRVAADNW